MFLFDLFEACFVPFVPVRYLLSDRFQPWVIFHKSQNRGLFFFFSFFHGIPQNR